MGADRERALRLEMAIARGDECACARELEEGADPNEAGLLGEPPLALAARGGRGKGTGSLELLKVLLSAGADPRAKVGGWTALGHAVDRGWAEMAELLLAAGADPNASGVGGRPELSAAMSRLAGGAGAGSEEEQLARSLLSAGADPSGALAVNPAALTITAGDLSKTYGQELLPAGTEFVASGLQNGETVGSVSLSSAGFAAGAGAGSYAIGASGASGGTFQASDYSISYADGALAVTAASGEVAFSGTPFNGGFGVNYSGFVAGDDAASLGGALAYGGSSQGATLAGTYGIEVSGLTSANYDLTFLPGELTIGASSLVSFSPRELAVASYPWAKAPSAPTVPAPRGQAPLRVTAPEFLESQSLFGACVGEDGKSCD